MGAHSGTCADNDDSDATQHIWRTDAFSLPEGAVVTGIVAVVHCAGDVDDDVTVEISPDNSAYGTGKDILDKGGTNCAGATDTSLGDSSDLWGNSWSQAAVNAGIYVRLTFSSVGKCNPWYVDYVQLTVHYSLIPEETFPETMTVSDQLEKRLKLEKRFTEPSVMGAEALEKRLILLKKLTETIEFIDQLQTTPIREFDETFTILDQLSKQINLLKRLTEDMPVWDEFEFQYIPGGIPTESFDETFTILDSLRTTIIKELTEVMTVTDALKTERTLRRQLQESIEVLDSLKKRLTLEKRLTETFTVLDQLQKRVDVERSMTEDFTVLDQLKSEGLVNRSFTETIEFLDSVDKQLALRKRLSETMTLVDELEVLITREFEETITIQDQLLKRLILLKRLTEDFTVQDGFSFQFLGMLVTEELSESFTISDAMSRQVALVRPLSEDMTISDQLTITYIPKEVELPTSTFRRMRY